MSVYMTACVTEIPKFEHSEDEWEDWKRNTLTGANIPFSPVDPRQPNQPNLTSPDKVKRKPPGRVSAQYLMGIMMLLFVFRYFLNECSGLILLFFCFYLFPYLYALCICFRAPGALVFDFDSRNLWWFIFLNLFIYWNVNKEVLEMYARQYKLQVQTVYAKFSWSLKSDFNEVEI